MHKCGDFQSMIACNASLVCNLRAGASLATPAVVLRCTVCPMPAEVTLQRQHCGHAKDEEKACAPGTGRDNPENSYGTLGRCLRGGGLAAWPEGCRSRLYQLLDLQVTSLTQEKLQRFAMSL